MLFLLIQTYTFTCMHTNMGGYVCMYACVCVCMLSNIACKMISHTLTHPFTFSHTPSSLSLSLSHTHSLRVCMCDCVCMFVCPAVSLPCDTLAQTTACDEIVPLLIEHGARVNEACEANAFEWTPLQIAVYSGKNSLSLSLSLSLYMHTCRHYTQTNKHAHTQSCDLSMFP